jgi:hypothetical protein
VEGKEDEGRGREVRARKSRRKGGQYQNTIYGKNVMVKPINLYN